MDSIPDILADANKNPASIMAHKGNKYLYNLLAAGFDPKYKLILPEGEPPYKSNGALSQHVTKGAFWQICRKLDIFLREDLTPLKREQQFITALESISEEDAKILLAVKDQTLDTLYPNLSYSVLKELGYFA